jgi:CubicO group peptidase (beta-lactamase class C family)
MKILFFIVCFLSINFAFWQVKSTSVNPDTLVKRLGKSFIDNPASVGLSIGIYNNGKSGFYNFGVTEKGKTKAPTQNTIYEIGSITKTFTSTLLAHAVLENKVELDDDIRKYIEGDYSNLEYNGKPIKLVHLANLTSGLPNWLPDRPDIFQNANPDSIPYILLEIHKNYSRQNFYDDLKKVKLDTIPGSFPKHSNVGAQLLAYIIENVYKMTYEQLVRKYITSPLRMDNTSMAASQTQSIIQAKGYNDKGKIMPYLTMKDLQVSGGLNSSASDMLKYVKYQLDKKNEAVKFSHQRTWKSPKGNAVGLNWQINKSEQGIRQIWHTGGTFGFSSYMVIYPELNIGLVLLANESDGTTQSKLIEVSEKIFEVIGHK